MPPSYVCWLKPMASLLQNIHHCPPYIDQLVNLLNQTHLNYDLGTWSTTLTPYSLMFFMTSHAIGLASPQGIPKKIHPPWCHGAGSGAGDTSGTWAVCAGHLRYCAPGAGSALAMDLQFHGISMGFNGSKKSEWTHTHTDIYIYMCVCVYVCVCACINYIEWEWFMILFYSHYWEITWHLP